MRWKTIGAVLLVVVGIGAAAIAVIGPSFGGTTATQYLTSQATVTDVVDQVAATGTVQAATTYALAFGSAPTVQSSSSSSSSASGSSNSGSGSGTSWTVATVTALPGQAVKAGDVLATSDGSGAALTLAVAQANLASAQARLASDKAGLTSVQKAAARLQVTQAQQSLAQSRTSYNSTLAQNRLKVKQAQASLTSAKKKLAADKKSHQPSAVISADKSAVTQATDNLASVKLQVSQSNNQAANQISQASLNVQSAQYAYQQKLVTANAATIATDKAAIAQAQQAVTTAKTALGYTSLVSPVDGVVVAVNVTPGLAAPSGAAITIRSTDLQVTASVTESDLPSVKIGQAVTVTITALGTDATGTVARIDQLPASSSSSVVSYGIAVALPKPPAGTVPGMSVQVSVTTASATNVLAVPAIALQSSSDGSYSVRVLDGSGQPQSVPVTVGLISTSLAEIKSGLNAGQAVVTGTASSRTSNGSSTTTTRGLNGGFGGGGFGDGGFPVQRP
jgi:RND family efflux transporter MFP subunit